MAGSVALLRAVGLGIVPVFVLGSCTKVMDATAARPAEAAPVRAPTIAIENVGNAPIRPDARISVRVHEGALQSVALMGEEGRLSGSFARRGADTWHYIGGLRPSASYRLVTRAKGADGRTVVDIATFETLGAKRLLEPTITPEDGATVGIGHPIKVEFNAPVANRAAVERRLRVTTSTPVNGAWHWMSDTEVRYRPETYWPGHTDVTVTADLAGVDAGNGTWGAADQVTQFTIDRAMRSVIDLRSFTMKVYEDGELLRSIPITGGKSGFTTRSGTKVVLGKEYHKIMDARSIGIPEGSPEYYRLHVYYAVRVTSSGEFVHAAPWSAWAHGRANASHGCIGMSTSNGRWFYNRSIIGDVIETTGTSRGMELSNGFGDWNLSWSDWLAGSALR